MDDAAEKARQDLQDHVKNGAFVEGSASAPLATTKAIATLAAALALGPAPAAPEETAAPAALTATFAETARQRPEDIYKGRAGYNLMLQEIRDSLYREIPEARGHIDIVNHLTDANEEAARLQQSLGIDDQTFTETLGIKTDGKNIKGGEASFRHLADGRYVCVASAWDPDTANADVDKMNFEDIRSHARIIAHETMHCLDPGHQDASLGEGIVTYNDIIYAGNSRKSEMYADVAADSLMLSNGDKKAGTVGMAMNYNTEAPARASNGTFGFVYDNGPAFLKIAARYDDARQPGLQNFNFTNWRQTMAQTEALRSQSEATSGNAIVQDMYQSYILSEAQGFHTDAAIAKSPYRDDKEFRANVEYLFNAADHDLFNKTSADPKLQAAVDTADAARIGYNNWVKDRADILPAAGRIVSSYEWVRNGGTGPIPAEAAQNVRHDPDVALGRAALKYQESGNPFDKKVFEFLSRAAQKQSNIDILLRDDDNREGWIDHSDQHKALLQDSAAAQRLANGEPGDKVFESLILPKPTPEQQPAPSSQPVQRQPAPGGV